MGIFLFVYALDEIVRLNEIQRASMSIIATDIMERTITIEWFAKGCRLNARGNEAV